MSDVTKLSAMFILSLCMTLTACGGGGGSGGGGSNGGGAPVDGGGGSDGGGDGGGSDGGGDGGGSDGGGDGGGSDGGGDAGGGDNPDEPAVDETAPEVTVSSTAIKQLHFSWTGHDDDLYYVLSQDPTGDAGFTQVAQIDEGNQATLDVSVHKHNGADTAFLVEAHRAEGEPIPSAKVTATEALIDAIGYFKASNTGPVDEFGQAVALSADGTTLAVGAHDEESGTGDETDNSVRSAGAVYVFAKTDSGWVQQAYLKASDIQLDDDFGHSLALSADGNTLAVGAPWEENAAEGDEDDTGAVYVFTRQEGVWSEQQYIRAATPRHSAHFGVGVSLSDDGNTLAVGAYGMDAISRTGSDGTPVNYPAVPGAVHVLTRSTDGVWTEVAELTGNNTEASDIFGYDVALNGDATTLAVGAYQESSAATGVDGDGADNSAAQAGAVYIFGQGASGWEQQAYLKASTTEAGAHFGYAIAINQTGDRLAVGAQNEASKAGAVHLFNRTDGVWSHQQRIVGTNTEGGDNFGADVALVNDGTMLAVGASKEDSPAQGVGGNESSNTGPNSGAVYVFGWGESGWSQTAFVKAPNTQDQAMFGHSVAFNADGSALAVGAIGEDGKSVGVSGDQTVAFTDEEVTEAGGKPVETGAGAVYLY